MKENSRTHKALKQGGFTIVELMLAMTIFSLILIAASAGIVQISRLYYKSAITSRTQDNARSIVTELSRSLQFSGATPVINNTGVEYTSGKPVRSVCIGSLRFSYVLDQQVGDDTPYVLWRDNEADSACTPLDVTDSNLGSVSEGIELIGENSRITRLNIENNRAKEYSVQLTVAYGDSDLFLALDASGDEASDPADIVRYICRPSGPSTQFCATAEIETLATRRL